MTEHPRRIVPKFSCIQELLESAQRTADRTALLSPGRQTLTYSDLHGHAEMIRMFLNSHGIGRKDRVAIVLPDGLEMAVTVTGVAACCGCAPLNPGYTSPEYSLLLKDLNASAVVVFAGAPSPVMDVARGQGIAIIELIPQTGSSTGLFRMDFYGRRKKALPQIGYSHAGDTAFLLPISGRTGQSEIVPLTQANVMAAAYLMEKSMQLTEQDRCLNVMPLFHSHGLIGALMSSLYSFGSVVCPPGYLSHLFKGWVDDLSPSWFSASPSIHLSVAENGERDNGSAKDFPSLRMIRSSSALLPPALRDRLERLFRVPVIDAYSMTEAAHHICCTSVQAGDGKSASVGKSEDIEVAVIDDQWDFVPFGQNGEIVIRGANVMRGYETNPDASADLFSLSWFRTGDEGYLDEQGYLYLTGCSKEIINRGGQKVLPAEIDEVLLGHPGVQQAISFSVPHVRLGETVCSAVVPVPKRGVTESELREYVAEFLAAYKVPQQIIFVDEIPVGSEGKSPRAELAGKWKPLLEPGFVPPEHGGHAALARIWQEVLGKKQVGLNDNFFALGGDTILAAEFLSRIRQETGFELPPERLIYNPTLATFYDVLANCSSEYDDMRRHVLGVKGLFSVLSGKAKEDS